MPPPHLLERRVAAGLPGGRVLIGVSGGADSVALLRAGVATGCEVVVAHCDHGLRANSGRDAEWVAELSATHGLRCVVGRVTVTCSGEGIEAAARRVRYAFLARTALETGAATVTVAHTADDQAETVLHHLLRGTGLRGLRGIPRRRRLADGITLTRPLLRTTRAEVEAYLDSLGQPFLTDPTNADPAFTRNRLRHDLLPRLRAEFNPQVDNALRRLARQAAAATVAVTAEAAGHLPTCLTDATPTRLTFARPPLIALPRPTRREVLILAWLQAGWPRDRMAYRHWQRLATLARRGGRVTLPYQTDARTSRTTLQLTRPD